MRYADIAAQVFFKVCTIFYKLVCALLRMRFAANSSSILAMTVLNVRTDIAISDACSKRLYLAALLGSLAHPVSALERRRACASARRRRGAARRDARPPRFNDALIHAMARFISGETPTTFRTPELLLHQERGRNSAARDVAQYSRAVTLSREWAGGRVC